MRKEFSKKSHSERKILPQTIETIDFIDAIEAIATIKAFALSA